MIGIVVVVLLACAAIVYVVAPLRRPGPAPASSRSEAIEEARQNKTAALTAIVDLEEEAQFGKLSQKELEVLRAGYEREALVALEQLDALTAAAADDPLEAEIEAMKKRLACPSCGAMRDEDATCSRCGV